jgi:hypothetical protein
MRWFRSNRLFSGYLALFALGLQFAVTFAHVHPQDFIPKAVSGFIGKASLPAQAADVSHSSTRPSDDHGNGLPHDDCPICASIYLLSSALIGQPPALSVPAAFGSVLLPSIGDFEFQPVRYFSFQTRAPPIV